MGGNKTLIATRMLSSRMPTARSLLYGGVSVWGSLSRGQLCQGEGRISVQGVSVQGVSVQVGVYVWGSLSRGFCSWGLFPGRPPRQRPPGNNLGPDRKAGSDIIHKPPSPMEKIADTSKNITSHQISFAAGNYRRIWRPN